MGGMKGKRRYQGDYIGTKAICERLGISKPTLYRWIRHRSLLVYLRLVGTRLQLYTTDALIERWQVAQAIEYHRERGHPAPPRKQETRKRTRKVGQNPPTAPTEPLASPSGPAEGYDLPAQTTHTPATTSMRSATCWPAEYAPCPEEARGEGSSPTSPESARAYPEENARPKI